MCRSEVLFGLFVRLVVGELTAIRFGREAKVFCFGGIAVTVIAVVRRAGRRTGRRREGALYPSSTLTPEVVLKTNNTVLYNTCDSMPPNMSYNSSVATEQLQEVVDKLSRPILPFLDEFVSFLF